MAAGAESGSPRSDEEASAAADSDQSSAADDNNKLLKPLPFSVPSPAYEVLGLALLVILGSGAVLALIAARRSRTGAVPPNSPGPARLPLPGLHLEVERNGEPTDAELEELLSVEEKTHELVSQDPR